MEACTPRKGGSREGGSFCALWSSLTGRTKGEQKNFGELGKVGDLEGRIQRSCISQPISSSHTLAPTRQQAQGAKKFTEALRHRMWVQGAKRRAHKPWGAEGWPGVPTEGNTNLCSTTGRPREPRERHTSPEVQRAGSGCAKKPTQVSAMQSTGLGSWEKLHASPRLASISLQSRAGPGYRSSSKNSRDK